MPELAVKVPVDLAHLARYTGGDRQLNSEVFRLFSDHCVQSLRLLQTSLNIADGKGWRDTAHALRGAALGVGAFRLAEQAGAAEAMDPGTDRTQSAIALATLRARSGVVLVYIEAYLASE